MNQSESDAGTSRMDIAVVGAGSFGTALAKLLANNNHRVWLWCFEEDLAQQLAKTRENSVYLPGVKLPESVRVSNDLAAVVSGKPIVLAVMPSHVVRSVMSQAAPYLDPDAVVVSASKGIEEGSLLRIDQVFAQIFSPEIAVRSTYLSGPTFAQELVQQLPAAIVIAGWDETSAKLAQEQLANNWLRVYRSRDVVGVQLGGALKNVIAVAAGLFDGLGFGLNARAALMTSGLTEIQRIGLAQGANPLTFARLSGMGDLVLTCTGELSRNRRLGLALAEGRQLQEITSEMKMVPEGAKNVRVAYDLTRKLSVNAPIIECMHDILYMGANPNEAIRQLIGGAFRDEHDW